MDKGTGKDIAKDDFSSLVDVHLKPVYNFIYRSVGNTEDAADLTQDTFLKAWKNIRKFKKGSDLKVWLFAIAKNCMIDLFRKKKMSVFSDITDPEEGTDINDLLIDPEPLPDEIFANAEQRGKISELLSAIPRIYREILILRYDEEMSFEDIARLLDTSADTIRSRHRRALILLKKMDHTKI